MPLPREPGDGPRQDPEDGRPLVELRRVRKSFPEGDGERVVFDGVDLAVARGEFLALIGRSGSGKSTLLNLISGIDLASSGEVWVAGLELGSAGERRRTLARREHIGFVFQFFNLIPTLTVAENLLFPLELKGRLDARSRERALGLLAEVGWDPLESTCRHASLSIL